MNSTTLTTDKPATLNNSFSTRIVLFILGVISPGLGYILLRKNRTGILYMLSTVTLICLLCWSRVIASTYGLHLLLAALIASLLISALSAVKTSRGVSPNVSIKNLGRLILFTVIWFGMLFGLFVSKKELLGFELYQIASISMEPTLHHGDIILADTWAYSESAPTYGEVVLLTVYQANGRVLVKRIAAMEGDKVAYNREVFRRVENPINMEKQQSEEDTTLSYAVVDSDHYFVVGDNVKASRDSRRFGAIAKNNLIGRALSVVYKANEGVQWATKLIN